MKIYTRTGDDGSTGLFGGKRVSKASLRIDTYGTIDELNSHIGLLRDQEVNQKRKPILIEIQDRLFTIGSILAVEPGNKKVKVPSLTDDDIRFLENEIDTMESGLTPIREFVLPGGHSSVSIGHIARTVCRRAERLVVALDEQEKLDASILHYLNRLSDFLFVLCRKITSELHAEETAWKPRL